MYLIFAGECFYSRGAASDFCKAIASKDEALKFAEGIIGDNAAVDWETVQIEWSQVICGQSGELIKNYGKDPYGHFDGGILEIVKCTD